MFVLSEGTGTWDGTTQGNSSNPARRDVQLIRPGGYIAIQVDADNPGIWPFHCHIAWVQAIIHGKDARGERR